MKNTFPLSIVSIGLLSLVACNPNLRNDDEAVESTMPVLGEEGSSVSEMIVTDDEGDDQKTEDAGGNGGTVIDEPKPTAHTISVSVDNWAFTPAVITVKKGEKITVRLNVVAGTHSFAVPGLGINQTLTPGQVADVVIPTDTAGTFDFRCTIPCGAGHKEMKGTIIITE